MKTKIALITLFISATVLFVGCSSVERGLYEQRVVTQPGTTVTNTTYTTNMVTRPAVTNAVTGEVTPAKTEAVVTPIHTVTTNPPVTVTNLVPKPMLETLTAGAGQLPIPFAGTAAALIGWGISAYAHFRNKKLSRALVEGIEAGRLILQETPEGQKLDGKIKDTLIQHQEAAGVLDAAAMLVNRYTSNTVK